MSKIINWFTQSNRWMHLTGGILIGAGADDTFCALYAGAGIASALELKDRLWGGTWDWIDWSLTIAGAITGRAIRYAICGKYFINHWRIGRMGSNQVPPQPQEQPAHSNGGSRPLAVPHLAGDNTIPPEPAQGKRRTFCRTNQHRTKAQPRHHRLAKRQGRDGGRSCDGSMQ